jgi:hypothetical protein
MPGSRAPHFGCVVTLVRRTGAIRDCPAPHEQESPKRKVPRLARLGQFLMIGAAVALVGFFAALITAIVTGGGG